MNIDTPILIFRKGNRKLDDRIYTFDLPAGHSCPSAAMCLAKADKTTGEITDGPDQTYRCFSATTERFQNVRDLRWQNFDLIRNKTEEEITTLITDSLPSDATVIRLHTSGDFFNPAYTKAWMNVATANPEILFYTYSKSVSFIKAVTVPENMVITFSLGGREDHLIDENMQTVKVVFSPEEAAMLNLEIDHDDSRAMIKGGNFALLLHGTQPAGSAASEALKKLRDENVVYSYPRISDVNTGSTVTTQIEAEINMEEICADADKQTVTVDPSILKQHPDNRRIYNSASRLVVLIESIIRMGLLQMIIVNESMEVLCGWRRLQAILAIGTFLQIEVVVVKLNPEDEAAFIVFSNSQRTKTALEKFREASVLKVHWAKKPGQRTDLQPQLSDVEKKRTRTRIADAIGITETEVHKLETVGEKDIAMLELVGDDVSLNEVYNAVKTDKPKHEEPVKEIDLNTINPCPYCGNMPRRIEIDENYNLKYKD